jgi:hypothetical protein
MGRGKKPQNFEDTFELTEGGARPLFDRTVDTTTLEGVAEYADNLLEAVRVGTVNSNVAKNLSSLLAVQARMAEVRAARQVPERPAVPQLEAGTTGMQLFRTRTVKVLEPIPTEGDGDG